MDITLNDLSPKQEAFAQHYVEHGCVADAYRSAYDVTTRSSATARSNGYRQLNHPKIAARVRELRTALAATSLMTNAELIADLEAMATADVNELMALTVCNCRYCWGEGNGYQHRDAGELGRAMDAYLASLGTSKPLPPVDASGGYGYRSDRGVNPDCPRCDGVGVNVVRLANTADVSPGARKLYRGVELYQDGSIKKILLNDPLAARMELHRLRGMLVDRSLSINANVAISQPSDLATPDALLAAFHAMGNGS